MYNLFLQGQKIMENKIKRKIKSIRAKGAQREKISAMLKSLAPEITAADRKAAAKYLMCTPPTIHSYLRGIVLNNDLGLDMIRFFKSKIEKRGQIINQLCGQSKKG